MTAAQPGEVVVQAGERRSARIESLRAVAALAVVVSHVWLYAHGFAPSAFRSFGPRLLAGGGFGVQLFFALSGYLIFRPFARRWFADGAGGGRAIDLRTYARNRALRILPLYLVAVTVLLVFVEHGGTVTQWARFPFFAQGFFTDTAQTVDPPLWSVAVEAQFYVLLPFLAWALGRVAGGRRRTGVLVLLALALPSLAFRIADPYPLWVWRFSLPATFYGFVPGMVLALLQIGWEAERPARVRGVLASSDAWLAASAVVWAACCWDYDWAVPLTAVASFLTVGAVVLPLAPGRLGRALDARALALVGVASYSLYVWHVPIIERLDQRAAFDSFVPLLLVAVPLALLAAAVSYAVVERPALGWRRSWAGPAAVDAGGAARARRVDVRVVAVLLLAFLVRARMVMASNPLVLSADPADYDRLGRLVAAGHGFGQSVLSPSGGPTAFRAPLYPWFLGAVYEVTGGSTLAARLVQAALGALTVWLVWRVGERLFGRAAGFAAAVLAAVYPPLAVTSAALMSEAIYLPILAGALLCALRAREGGEHANRWALAVGALAGLGMLARPNSLATVPALLLLVAAWTRTGWDRRRAGVRVGAVVLALVVVLVPWQVRNAATMHGTVLVSDIDGYNFAGVYNDDSASSGRPTTYQFRPPNGVASMAPLFADPAYDEVSLGVELRRRGLDHIKAHPTAPAQALFWNSYRMLELSGLDQSTLIAREAGFGRTTALVGMLSFWAVALAAVVGACTGVLRRAPLALWLAPVLLWIGTALFLGNARLRAPVEPFLLLAAAPVVVTAVERLRDLAGARRTSAVVPG